MREIFLRIAGLSNQAPTPTSCTQTRHRFAQPAHQTMGISLLQGAPIPPKNMGPPVAMGKSVSAPAVITPRRRRTALGHFLALEIFRS